MTKNVHTLDVQVLDEYLKSEIDDFKGIDGISAGLGHLLPVPIQNHVIDDDVFKAWLAKQMAADRVQGVEPSTGLIHSFGNEIRRKRVLENIFVFERVMPLGKWHRSRVKPDVNDFRYSFHDAATGAIQSDGIDKRLV